MGKIIFFVLFYLCFIFSHFVSAELPPPLQADEIIRAVKELGLDSGTQTFGQVWEKLSAKMPPEIRKSYEPHFALYRNEKFPQILLRKDRSTGNLMIVSKTDQQETVYVFPKRNSLEDIQIQGLLFRLHDFEDPNRILRDLRQEHPKYVQEIFKKDPPPFPSRPLSEKEILGLKAPERIQYMIHLRQVMESSHAALSQLQEKKRRWASLIWSEIFFAALNTAEASTPQQRRANRSRAGAPRRTSEPQYNCLVGGWLSRMTTVGGNRVCSFEGAIAPERRGLSGGTSAFLPNPTTVCQRGTIPCNPLFYGFRSLSANGNHSPHCVAGGAAAPRAPSSTAACSAAAPLDGSDESIRRLANQIFQSYKNTPQNRPEFLQAQERMRECTELFTNDRPTSEACVRYIQAFGETIYHNAKRAHELCMTSGSNESADTCAELARRLEKITNLVDQWQRRGGHSSSSSTPAVPPPSTPSTRNDLGWLTSIFGTLLNRPQQNRRTQAARTAAPPSPQVTPQNTQNQNGNDPSRTPAAAR